MFANAASASFSRRLLSTTPSSGPLVLKTFKNGVLTLTMNNPDRLNAWTKSMFEELKNGLRQGQEDSQTKVK